jgi:hypothetical protein
MSLERPRKLNRLFGVEQRGHGHKPISLIVAIRTLRVYEFFDVLIRPMK